MEVEDGVLILKRIHERYTLRAPEETWETARRVHEMHAQKCPVYRSIGGCVDITTELTLEASGG